MAALLIGLTASYTLFLAVLDREYRQLAISLVYIL